MSIVQGLIGASPKQVWKPLGAVGAASDATAPFELGTTVTGTSPRNLYVFARVGASGIAAGATTGITNGVTVAAAAGNTYTWEGTVPLVTGDYAFFSVAAALAP